MHPLFSKFEMYRLEGAPVMDGHLKSLIRAASSYAIIASPDSESPLVDCPRTVDLHEGLVPSQGRTVAASDLCFPTVPVFTLFTSTLRFSAADWFSGLCVMVIDS